MAMRLSMMETVTGAANRRARENAPVPTPPRRWGERNTQIQTQTNTGNRSNSRTQTAGTDVGTGASRKRSRAESGYIRDRGGSLDPADGRARPAQHQPSVPRHERLRAQQATELAQRSSSVATTNANTQWMSSNDSFAVSFPSTSTSSASSAPGALYRRTNTRPPPQPPTPPRNNIYVISDAYAGHASSTTGTVTSVSSRTSSSAEPAPSTNARPINPLPSNTRPTGYAGASTAVSGSNSNAPVSGNTSWVGGTSTGRVSNLYNRPRPAVNAASTTNAASSSSTSNTASAGGAFNTNGNTARTTTTTSSSTGSHSNSSTRSIPPRPATSTSASAFFSPSSSSSSSSSTVTHVRLAYAAIANNRVFTSATAQPPSSTSSTGSTAPSRPAGNLYNRRRVAAPPSEPQNPFVNMPTSNSAPSNSAAALTSTTVSRGSLLEQRRRQMDEDFDASRPAHLPGPSPRGGSGGGSGGVQRWGGQ